MQYYENKIILNSKSIFQRIIEKKKRKSRRSVVMTKAPTPKEVRKAAWTDWQNVRLAD